MNGLSENEKSLRSISKFFSRFDTDLDFVVLC